MQYPDKNVHGVFLPASYKQTFRLRDLADVTTVRVPIVTPSRLTLQALITLTVFTILFAAMTVWLAVSTSIGWLGVAGVATLLYSSLCACVI